MTNEQYMEDIVRMSDSYAKLQDSYMARVKRVAELKEVLRAARNALSETALRVGNGYDWNADPDNITLLQGEAFSKIDEALKLKQRA